MKFELKACTGKLEAASSTASTLLAQTYYDTNTASSLVASPSIKSLFNNWDCAQVTTCSIDAPKTSLSLVASADGMDWSINFDNKQTGFVATDAVVSCTQKGATAAVDAKISFTWTGCKAAARANNIPSFSFPGSNDGKPF